MKVDVKSTPRVHVKLTQDEAKKLRDVLKRANEYAADESFIESLAFELDDAIESAGE